MVKNKFVERIDRAWHSPRALWCKIGLHKSQLWIPSDDRSRSSPGLLLRLQTRRASDSFETSILTTPGSFPELNFFRRSISISDFFVRTKASRKMGIKKLALFRTRNKKNRKWDRNVKKKLTTNSIALHYKMKFFLSGWLNTLYSLLTILVGWNVSKMSVN